MDEAYRQTVNAATASLDWNAKEKLVLEITESQRKLAEVLSKLDEVRNQCHSMEEENAMLRKYRDNLAAAARTEDA
ncbi:hypothetical protein THASP1DRAFT_32630 [Thamnocephalis sphaerospora]|uniref:Uncharacterized protein n=1 Tax=Thamnocephalis sphaerospora TaxID=78915 RepID=A0A4P9XIJ9_9FUNG|nr:hypothetical protein THASP1DRAFT_32630 [Thamnocephalis sphaerospora]|eukprot:RKP05532.1 hypothetical protein THASP1DRAFT_32630 [Thamnocephalis sphaerospora]